MSTLAADIIATFVFTVVTTLITAFFALHAAQHVADPGDRAAWLMIIIFFTLLGSAIYAFTKYRAFRKIGKGHVIQCKPASLREFIALSDREKMPYPAASSKEAPGQAHCASSRLRCDSAGLARCAPTV